MSQLFIVTTPENSGLGTPLATAFNYTNSNFSELYARYQVNPPANLTGQDGDVPGMYATDSSYFYYCYANYDGSSTIWAQVTQVGNISVTKIQNGTSNVSIDGSGANVTVGVNGVPNVVVFTTTGVQVTGRVSASGNVTGSYILGNGSQLTGLPALYSDANVTALMAAFGSNAISTTGNITSDKVFTAGNISATGNIAGNYILGNGSQLTGLPALYGNTNVSAFLSAFGSNAISTTGTVTAGNITGANILTAGSVSATGNITNQGNLVTQGVVSAIGNIITDGYFVGTFFGNVTGNFVVPGSNTQVIFNTSGNADAVGGFTYNKDSNTMTVLGIVSSQGNVVGGNITTAGQVSATGNITGGNLSATNISGILTTAGQPNITTVGTLGNLSVSGITTTDSVVATGNVAGGNINSAGQISTAGDIVAGNVICNGALSGISTSGGTITGLSLSVSGNVTGANLTGTLTTATQLAITTVGTLGSLSVTANVQAGNLRTTGNIAGGNLSITDINAGGNISATRYTGTIVSVTANVTGGNIFTAGLISATGNITGNYILGNGRQLTGVVSSYGDSNVATLLSAFGNNDISTTGTVTSASTVGGVITASSVSASGNITGNDYLGNTVSVTGNVTGTSLVGTVATASQPAITAVGTLDDLSVAGTITGGNLTLGTGSLTVGNILCGAGNLEGTIGNATTWFGNAYVQAVNALYADLAENYTADAVYSPGTVVVFGGEQQITVTNEHGDERVAGVVSTNPAYLMNSGETGTAVALRGQVPVRVQGSVVKGDSLVTSTVPGVAESVGRSRNYAQAVFAKALETSTGSEERVILAVII